MSGEKNLVHSNLKPQRGYALTNNNDRDKLKTQRHRYD